MNEQRCTTLNLLHILGKKWSVPTLEELYYSKNNIQFNELNRRVAGITPKNLTSTLRELNLLGLIKKMDMSIGNSKRIEYSITKNGELAVSLIKTTKEYGAYITNGEERSCRSRKCIECADFKNL
ncbi:MAG: winged helix-turn-helix transcriptional regulator [Candidatus Marsarchaeota archaeon]|nr:winged helix-turn-helix transcriptional regulator [Candidatus Marsarchaeota archaeon]